MPWFRDDEHGGVLLPFDSYPATRLSTKPLDGLHIISSLYDIPPFPLSHPFTAAAAAATAATATAVVRPSLAWNVPYPHSRHFAASLTPHARDLPNRRALMYSDWEHRSTSAAGAAAEGEGVVAEAGGIDRKLALREPLTQVTTGIISGSVVSGRPRSM